MQHCNLYHPYAPLQADKIHNFFKSTPYLHLFFVFASTNMSLARMTRDKELADNVQPRFVLLVPSYITLLVLRSFLIVFESFCPSSKRERRKEPFGCPLALLKSVHVQDALVSEPGIPQDIKSSWILQILQNPLAAEELMFQLGMSLSSSERAKRRSPWQLKPVSGLSPKTAKKTYCAPSNTQIAIGVPNAAVFTFNKEDHTLGELLRSRLLKDKRVIFSGYKVEHPLLPKFDLRVQTDGEITPKEAVLKACRDTVQDLAILSREFTKEFELKKIARNDTDT